MSIDLQTEVDRLRAELIRCRQSSTTSVRDHAKDLKATWYDVLAMACEARGIMDPMFLVDEYDRVYGVRN